MLRSIAVRFHPSSMLGIGGASRQFLPVIDHELDRPSAVVVVDGGVIHGAYPPWRALAMVEAYRLYRQPAVRKPELEMLAADHALRGHVEFIAETRRGEALPPDAVAQQGSGFQAEKLALQAAICLYRAQQIGRGEERARRFLERIPEAAEIGLAQGKAGGCGMTPELEDEAGVAHRDAVDGVAQMKARDRTPGPADLAVSPACEGNRRPMKPLLDAPGDNADHALVPGAVEEAQAVIVAAIHPLNRFQRSVLHFRFDLAALA